jgi:hypothetical protein
LKLGAGYRSNACRPALTAGDPHLVPFSKKFINYEQAQQVKVFVTGKPF